MKNIGDAIGGLEAGSFFDSRLGHKPSSAEKSFPQIRLVKQVAFYKIP